MIVAHHHKKIHIHCPNQIDNVDMFSDEQVGQASVSSFSMSDDPCISFLELQDDDRPSSLSKCLDDNGVNNPAKFMLYLEKEHELRRLERNIFFADENTEEIERPKKKRKARSCKSLCPYCYDSEGKVVLLQPRSTVWYFAYAINSPVGKWHDKFRKRFRMPHSEFLVLLDEVKQHDLF